MVWIVILILLGLALFIYFKFFKIPKVKNIIFVDGSLGTGKSFFCVNMAIRLYKRNLRHYKICKVVYKYLKPLGRFKRFHRLKTAYLDLEKPLLFSNIPLKRVKFSKLTLDVLLRKVRIPYKSVVLIDEFSMVADQFDYKDRDISESLRDFFKLFRHEVHGGYLITNSQSTSDLHYSLKSVLSDYFYLHHKVKLPFFSILWCQEMAYSSDKDANAVTNVQNADIEENLKMVFVRNKYYKYYDTYCFSILTDNLEVKKDWYILDRYDSAKTKEVLSFRKNRYVVHDKEDKK